MAKTRVLFVCIGNACRSPMAEGFARAYGLEVLEPQSAGLAPASGIVSMTRQVMLEKNIDLSASYSKHLDEVEGPADLIINMSGHEFRAPEGTEVENWQIYDPIGESEEVFRQVRDEIEYRVRDLIERLRVRKPVVSQSLAAASDSAAAPVDTRRRPTRQ